MIPKCECGWSGDLHEALIWIIQEGEPAINGHFELECPKCNKRLSVCEENKK